MRPVAPGSSTSSADDVSQDNQSTRTGMRQDTAAGTHAVGQQGSSAGSLGSSGTVARSSFLRFFFAELVQRIIDMLSSMEASLERMRMSLEARQGVTKDEESDPSQRLKQAAEASSDFEEELLKRSSKEEKKEVKAPEVYMDPFRPVDQQDEESWIGFNNFMGAYQEALAEHNDVKSDLDAKMKDLNLSLDVPFTSTSESVQKNMMLALEQSTQLASVLVAVGRSRNSCKDNFNGLVGVSEELFERADSSLTKADRSYKACFEASLESMLSLLHASLDMVALDVGDISEFVVANKDSTDVQNVTQGSMAVGKRMSLLEGLMPKFNVLIDVVGQSVRSYPFETSDETKDSILSLNQKFKAMKDDFERN